MAPASPLSAWIVLVATSAVMAVPGAAAADVPTAGKTGHDRGTDGGEQHRRNAG